MWHRCEQAARGSSLWAAHLGWLLPSLAGRAGTVLWTPVSHMQNSCLPGDAWLWSGTHCTPGEPSAAWPCLRHGGEVRSCGSVPWGAVSSVQAINTSVSNDLAGRAAKDKPGQLHP